MIGLIQHFLALRAQARHEASTKRSPFWPHLEKQHKLEHPACISCGMLESVQVHHIKPFHLRPELELDPENLVSLCMAAGRDCHLRIGHGGDFKAYNLHVVAWAENVRLGRWTMDKAAKMAKRWREYA